MRRRQVLKLLPLGLAVALGTFQVGSAAPNGSVRFLAVSDTGSGDANQRAVGAQMAAVHRQRPVDLVVLGGDNIYPSGDMALIGATFQRPYAELLAAKVPFHAVLGNHDIRTDNGDPQVAYKPFGMKGRFYNLRRGDLELFMLDTNNNADWARQLSWLRSALAGSTAPWKVVVGHHPIYSSGYYGNSSDLRGKIGALMQRYGVQLYINGHEHNYERSRPIDGITYLVVGGGGAALRPILPTDQSARAVSAYSFAEIEASPKELSVAAWNSSGQLIDRAVIARR
ncbi:MAG: metallophosphoesterase [Cyanobacteria bacterium M_surface_10_m2_179]|nr:metallophosphoesterase [Cyanobacteria bacterium M_surface_10_m2_179]